jgi:hypothetical protein
MVARRSKAVSHLPPNHSFRKLPWHQSALCWIFSETRAEPVASQAPRTPFDLPRAQ